MRRTRGVMLVLAGLAIATAVRAAAPASDPSDMVRGSPTAPVTIIEYASVGCPHCGRLHREVFPAFKAKYIDTGQVRWVAREDITGDPYLATGGFLLARCAGKEKYFTVTDAIYADQDNLANNLHDGLLALAKKVGLSEKQFDDCLKSKANADALDKRLKLAAEDKIDSTPTLVVNGKIVADGEVSLEKLDEIVAQARKDQGLPPAPQPQKKG